MSKSEDKGHWIGRLIGGVLVGGAAYVLLLFWNTWELGPETRALIACGCGVLFFLIGGSVWRWIDEIDIWS